VAVASVFDGQLVQAGFLAHFLELVRRWVLEADPDGTIGAFDILADVFLRDVAELCALLIRDAVHEHGRLLVAAAMVAAGSR
jgi:hypothetical protein